MTKITLRKQSAGHYEAKVAGKTYTVMHSGPNCWAFWPKGDPDGADAMSTLAEVREALAQIER